MVQVSAVTMRAAQGGLSERTVGKKKNDYLVLLDIDPQSASELEENGSFVSVLQGEIVGKLNYSLIPANTQC